MRIALLAIGALLVGAAIIGFSDNIVLITVLVFLGIAFLFVGLMWKAIITPLKIAGIQRKTAEVFLYDPKTKVLKLLKKSPDMAKFIGISPVEVYDVKYKEKKLHVGAVSVGGVTTGGAYTTGGYNYIDSAKKSGKFELVYLGNVISKIQLSNQMYAMAETSDIAEYLDGDTKQIKVEVTPVFTDEEKEKIVKNMKSNGYVGEEFAARGKPSFEKCEKILKWMEL